MHSFPVHKSSNRRDFLKSEGSSLMGMMRISMRSGFRKDGILKCAEGYLVLFIYLKILVFEYQCSPGIF